MVKRKAAVISGDEPVKKQRDSSSVEEFAQNGPSDNSDNSDQESSSSGDEMDQDDDQDELEREREADEAPRNKPTSQLTSQDVQVARETAEMYKSNIFKLQIDELLKELNLDDKKCQQMERSLFEINSSLQSIRSDSKEYTVDKVHEAISNTSVEIPFPDPKPPKDANYKFSFAVPDDINVIGSYSLKTSVKQPEGIEIDLWVSMPSSLFQEKDYINYRYFYKRAFYLAMLADHLTSNGDDIQYKSIKYAYHQGDPLKPIIKVKLDKMFTVNILVGLGTKVFEPRKLGPDRNCVRLQASSSEPGHVVPTPLYNSSVLADTTHQTYLKLLHTAGKQCPEFVAACKLGRLWLRQRGFGSAVAQGGFGHFEFAMLMAALLKGQSTKVLMNGYSSYQLFKSTIKFLATDYGSKAVYFTNTKSMIASTKTHEHPGLQASPAVLFDEEHKLNIFYKVSGWSCAMIKHEARITTDMLADVVRDRFDSIFMRDVSLPHLRYDLTFNVSFNASSTTTFLPSDKVKYSSYRHFFVEKLYRVLKRGYGERVKQIALFDTSSNSSSSWNMNKRKLSSSATSNSVTVGLVLDASECDKVMTHGPNAEDEQEAEQFRQFWGRISELRRFQDGRIAESIVWPVTPTKPVVITIAEHLLNRLFSDADCDLSFDNSLYSYLPVANVPGVADASVSSNALYTAKYNAFQKLSTEMQDLKDIPLIVRSIQPISSSLRHTSLHQPIPFDLDGDDAIASGIIEFETSSRWPDELNAIEKTKTAFLLQIGQKLEKKSNGKYVAFVGLDTIDEETEVGFLQVQTPEGYMFKLRIKTDRDLGLYNDKKEWYMQNYNGAMAHSRTIYRMSLRYPFYSATVRLLKQWFNSQLLMGEQKTIREEVVELLALIPFVDSAPYAPPASPVCGFFRVLDFLARWDWRDEPVILDVERPQDVMRDDENDKLSDVDGVEMSNNVYTDLSSAFTARRSIDQALTQAPLFIGTMADPTGILWTEHIPKSEVGKVVASRLTALSRGVSQLALAADEQEGLDSDTIFTPSLDDYDVVIHTVDPHGEGRKNSSNKQYKNLKLNQSFPPLEDCVDQGARVVDAFYNDISGKFSSELILFKGGSTSSARRPRHGVIAGIWNRDVLKERKFKVNLGYNSAPIDKEGNVKVNKEAIMAIIARMGGDMVRDVALN